MHKEQALFQRIKNAREQVRNLDQAHFRCRTDNKTYVNLKLTRFRQFRESMKRQIICNCQRQILQQQQINRPIGL